MFFTTMITREIILDFQDGTENELDPLPPGTPPHPTRRVTTIKGGSKGVKLKEIVFQGATGHPVTITVSMGEQESVTLVFGAP